MSVVMMPTLLSLLTTSSATCVDKVGIMMIVDFQWWSYDIFYIELSIYVHNPAYIIIAYQLSSLNRDHSRYELCQWEKALHSNAFSHWLSLYPEKSLHHTQRGTGPHTTQWSAYNHSLMPQCLYAMLHWVFWVIHHHHQTRANSLCMQHSLHKWEKPIQFRIFSS